MNIAPIQALSSITGTAASGTGGSGFSEVLGSAIGAVEQSQQTAKTAALNLLTAGNGDVHTVALAAQRAELSLELFQQVRNKFVSAYQEIMKMPM